jgi:hypothetical protein
MPFDFSWLAWLGTALPLWWYWRGLALLPPAERPRRWRRFAFTLGMACRPGSCGWSVRDRPGG